MRRKYTLAERRQLESHGGEYARQLLKDRGFEKTPQEKQDAKTKSIIEEEYKKPANEDGWDKIKRLQKKNKLEFDAQMLAHRNDRKQEKNAFQKMKAKMKDLKNKEEQLKKLQEKRALSKAFGKMKAKSSSLNTTKSMTHDLANDCKSFIGKHLDELQVIQSNIDLERKRQKGKHQSDKAIDNEMKATVQPLVKIIQSFIGKGYQISDTKDIIDTLGFDIPNEYIDLVKKMVSISTNKKQTKRQETRQYPPRYTTSKPQPIIDIISTNKPKLNLSHIYQVDKPASVSPSENTRKPKLEVSSSVHHKRENRTDYSIGIVKGVEADNRIFNSELKKYSKALTKLQEKDALDQLPQRQGIHATNKVRTSVRSLVPGRLTFWR